MRDWPWSELDLAPTADRAEIKRAYAAKLKTLDRERDVEGFQALRTAYGIALDEATSRDVDYASRGGSSSDRSTDEVMSGEPRDETESKSVSIAKIVDEVLAISTRTNRADLVRSWLDAEQELINVYVRDDVGLRGAERLTNTNVSSDVVVALSEFFAWEDRRTWSSWPGAVRWSFLRWMKSRELEKWIAGPGEWSKVREDVKKLRFWLGDNPAPWRAFLIGFAPMLYLGLAMNSVRRHFGSDWDLIVRPGQYEFFQAVAGHRLFAPHWYLSLLGELTFVGGITIGLVELTRDPATWGPRTVSDYWIPAAFLAQSAFRFSWMLLEDRSSPIARWLADITVRAMGSVIVFVAVAAVFNAR
jgi:hypothetical protein